MNTPNNVEVPTSFLEKLKTWFNWEKISAKLNLSSSKLMEIGVYLAVGFLAGFFLKKYAQFVAFTVLIVVSLVLLAHFNFISIVIHWEKIESFFGIQSVVASSGMFATFFAWVELNLLIFVSFVVGFLVGIKIG